MCGSGYGVGCVKNRKDSPPEVESGMAPAGAKRNILIGANTCQKIRGADEVEMGKSGC